MYFDKKTIDKQRHNAPDAGTPGTEALKQLIQLQSNK